jgi:hypothetical protein
LVDYFQISGKNGLFCLLINRIILRVLAGTSIKWAVAMKLEMFQLNDFECFIDTGIYNCDPISEGKQEDMGSPCVQCQT